MTESRVNLSGVPIEAASVKQAVSHLCESSEHKSSSNVYRFLNAFSLASADMDDSYKTLLLNGGLNFPDGKPLAVYLRKRFPEGGVGQVAGPEFFFRSLDRGRGQGLRHFFLGGDHALLRDLAAQAERRFPGVQVVGSFSPPFRAMTNEEQQEQDELILNSGADVVWVALGTPKQDFEADRIWRATGLNVAAVGAAFDFLAGTKPRAPEWVSRVGLEWLFRLSTEPRRLWRRYLFGNARFVRMVLRDLWMR